MAEEKPSLHIDTDWKRQAQEEKKRLAEEEARKAKESAARQPLSRRRRPGPPHREPPLPPEGAAAKCRRPVSPRSFNRS